MWVILMGNSNLHMVDEVKSCDWYYGDPFKVDWRSQSKIIIARILWIGRYCIADPTQPCPNLTCYVVYVKLPPEATLPSLPDGRRDCELSTSPLPNARRHTIFSMVAY